MKNFQGKVAVITGGASGFGREFALKAHALGMKLVLGDVQQDALDATTAELRGLGAQVAALRCDVRQSADVQALADAAMREFGAVHLVFNNAGVGFGGLLWEASEADWDWVMGVNVSGVVHGVRIFTPLMLECAKRDPAYEGHIVNTSSMAGVLCPPVMGVYNVSKHAVVALTESLYHDLALVQAPIGASVLCPFFVPTGIHQSHRNRPQDMPMAGRPTASQMAAQSMVSKAVTSGKVSAQDVAELTFAAIAEERFYIFTHPQALDGVAQRARDMVAQTNPADPYAATPQVRDALRAML
ncbi:SDR family oxidoreductase [Pseudoduganella violaceinigra]|uniref:SDR family oxidoreductase n=1 Tax=Pseudoduganella violaceinigra TaxID=246602 RepID=UPI00041540DA|nr:SDR family oxidoreductase [Pseudoduganella violaceinigra]